MTRTALLVCLGALLAGCLPDGLTDFDFRALVPPPPEPEAAAVFEPVGEAMAGAFRVVVYAEGGARAGRRALRIGVADARGAIVVGAAVSLTVEAARGAGWAVVPSGVAGPTDADGYAAAEALLMPERDGADVRFRVSIGAD